MLAPPEALHSTWLALMGIGRFGAHVPNSATSVPLILHLFL